VCELATPGQAAATAPDVGDASRWALGLLALAQFTVLLSINLPVVAVPAVARDLGLPLASAQFVVTAYALVWGSLLLLGGRSADLLGRRRVLLLGLWVFVAGCLLAAVGPSGAAVVGGRGIQGLGAAFLAPAALSLLTTTLPPGPPRDRGLALMGSATAAGAVAGLLLGGLLTEAFGWRTIFLAPLVPALLLAALAPRRLPAGAAAAGGGGFDVLGAALIASGLGLLALGASQVSTLGLADLRGAGALGLGAALVALFVVRERHARSPLLPPALLARRSIGATTAVTALVWTGFASLFFHTALLLQDVLGYRALTTGLAYLPLAAATVAGSRLAARSGGRRSARTITALGAGGIASGSLLLSRADPGDPYALLVLPGLVAAGAGLGLALVSLQVTIFAGVSRPQSGVVAGLFATAQEVASALGTAALAGLASAQASPEAGLQLALLAGSGIALLGGLLAAAALPR
jgi:predicted MFS family arabinose efflux permease